MKSILLSKALKKKIYFRSFNNKPELNKNKLELNKKKYITNHMMSNQSAKNLLMNIIDQSIQIKNYLNYPFSKKTNQLYKNLLSNDEKIISVLDTNKGVIRKNEGRLYLVINENKRTLVKKLKRLDGSEIMIKFISKEEFEKGNW